MQRSIIVADMLHVSVLTVALCACIAHFVLVTMLLGTQDLKDDGFVTIQASAITFSHVADADVQSAS